MDSSSWTARFSTSSSRRYPSSSRSDLFLGGGYEDFDGDDDLKAEFLCPFCAEDFDMVGLCCHMDEEHPVEAKNGICPICAKRVGMDIIGHITVQHGSFLKVQRKRRLRKGGSNLTFSMLRKELRDGNFQALLGGSPCIVSSSSAEPDPLLSSFIFNPPAVDEPASERRLSAVQSSAVKDSLNKEFLERKPMQPQLSDKEHEEKARRSEFVQGLLLSTILDDNL